MTPAERLQHVRDQLEQACATAGRSRADVTLIAVSKRHPDEAVRQLAGLGQVDFGENLVQAWQSRCAGLVDLQPPVRWHLIGPVQSKKARDVAAGRPALLHTVDRPRLVDALSRRLEGAPPLDVLIQVNVDREPQKAGVLPEDLDGLVDHVAASQALRLRGLMCIPRPPGAGATPRTAFAGTRELAHKVADRIVGGQPLLSMGMSADFVDAIAEGATHIRVGTALFGSRPS